MLTIFLKISLLWLVFKKVVNHLKFLQRKSFVQFHFKLSEISISPTSVKIKELFLTISSEQMHWNLSLFLKNLFGDLKIWLVMVCSLIHGLSTCVMTFHQKIKVVEFWSFSIMVKNIINGKINMAYKLHMKIS